MSRIRTVKPEWLEDERLALASSDARVLSIALILLADDYGNGRANVMVLGAVVFPGADNARATFTAAAEELTRIRFVAFYEVDGQRYFSIRNWSKHQRVDRPSEPKVPGPPQEDDDTATLHRHTADGPGVGAQNRADTADGPGPTEHAGTVPVSDGNHTLPNDSRKTREDDTRDSRQARSSRDPFPSSGSLSLPLKLLADQPENSGSARARSKPRAKGKPVEDRVPRPLAADWQPDAEQVTALALKHSVTEARVRSTVPEFVWYWRKEGKRSTGRGWDQSFGNNVDRLARNGQLYIARPDERTSAPGADNEDSYDIAAEYARRTGVQI